MIVAAAVELAELEDRARVERVRHPEAETTLRTALDESRMPVDMEIVDCSHSMDVLAIGGIARCEG